MPLMIRGARSGLILLAVMALAGCSALRQVLPERTPAYQDGKVTRPLEVPPGLTAPATDTSMQIPESRASSPSGATAAPEAAPGTAPAAASAPAAPAPIKGIRVVRGGSERWLVVDAAPASVWPRVREFWLKNGFLIARENAGAGILETNWAEYRPNIAEGPIRMLLSKVVSGMYSAPFRSQYLVRVEPGVQAGTTEVFISERGMREVSNDDTFIWQMNPPNPDREAAMLRRLMVFLGASKAHAAASLAHAPQSAPRAKLLHTPDGALALVVEDPLVNAWSRTGIALDRVGLLVQNQDRAQGIYYVRYDDPLKGEAQRGLFSRWFGSNKPHGKRYRIRLTASADNETRVEVLSDSGKPDHSPRAQHILKLLEEQLR